MFRVLFCFDCFIVSFYVRKNLPQLEVSAKVWISLNGQQVIDTGLEVEFYGRSKVRAAFLFVGVID